MQADTLDLGQAYFPDYDFGHDRVYFGVIPKAVEAEEA